MSQSPAGLWDDYRRSEHQSSRWRGVGLRLLLAGTSRAAGSDTGRSGRTRDRRVASPIGWPPPGVLAAEHKSREHRDDKVETLLARAEEQALDYLDSLDELQLPRWIVPTDFGHLGVTDMLSPGEAPAIFPLVDLPEEIDRLGLFAGHEKRKFTARTGQAANIAAAKRMADLYEQLADDGYGDHEASVLLLRLLFLLFGDDTGMWEKSLFLEFVETRTAPDLSDFGPQLMMLFQTVNTPEDHRPTTLDELLARFPYVSNSHDATRCPAHRRCR